METQSLLYRTNILISDYSAIYIDFLATNRPIILYPYDYKDFTSNMRELFFRMEDNHVGYKPVTPEQFSDCLEKVLQEPEDEIHEAGRAEMRSKYYNPGQKLGTSREYLYTIILKLLDGTFVQMDRITNEE